MKRRSEPTPEFCPNCGAEVPERASACPECGSCAETGWSEKARYDALDLPDPEFDYQDFVDREFNPSRKLSKNKWLWVAVALLLLASFVLYRLGVR